MKKYSHVCGVFWRGFFLVFIESQHEEELVWLRALGLAL